MRKLFAHLRCSGGTVPQFLKKHFSRFPCLHCQILFPFHIPPWRASKKAACGARKRKEKGEPNSQIMIVCSFCVFAGYTKRLISFGTKRGGEEEEEEEGHWGKKQGEGGEKGGKGEECEGGEEEKNGPGGGG